MHYSKRVQEVRTILRVIRVALVVMVVVLPLALWVFKDRMSRTTLIVTAAIGVVMVSAMGYGLRVGFRDLPELEELARKADND